MLIALLVFVNLLFSRMIVDLRPINITNAYMNIKLPCGSFCKVDDDFQHSHTFHWYRRKSKSSSYVVATYLLDGKKQTVRLHRLVINAAEGDFVDHINGDTMNNCKSNLRIVTRSQNNQNNDRPNIFKRKDRNNSWASCITIHNKSQYVGHSHTRNAAIAKWLKAKIKYYPNHCERAVAKWGHLLD